eukprot:6923092-Karenia_brevis.AAC.1
MDVVLRPGIQDSLVEHFEKVDDEYEIIDDESEGAPPLGHTLHDYGVFFSGSLELEGDGKCE